MDFRTSPDWSNPMTSKAKHSDGYGDGYHGQVGETITGVLTRLEQLEGQMGSVSAEARVTLDAIRSDLATLARGDADCADPVNPTGDAFGPGHSHA
jgi:hypothetical protein